MKILHFSLGLYNFWTTYEGEYMNESLLRRPDVDLNVWGRDRVTYEPGLTCIDVVKKIYGNEYPDVVIFHSTMEKHDDPNDRKVFEGIRDLGKHSTIVWRTFDCFKKKLPFYVKQIKAYHPHIVLVWYASQAAELRSAIGQISHVCHFPHSVGRRYFNKMNAREYDIALIGRCDGVSLDSFPELKVYTPPHRETRPEKGNNLIDDLNQCMFSWNSPVKGDLASLRFFESPACGTISMVPKKFADLDQYFPSDSYCVCDSSTETCSNIIRTMDAREKWRIQQRGYEVVMSNHTMDNRVDFLLDVVGGKNVYFYDYYGIKI